MKSLLVKSLWSLTAACLLIGTAQAEAPGESPVDPTLPIYHQPAPVKGAIRMIGSDTISAIASTWASKFQRMHPDTQFDIQVKGSVSAVPAVINGEATFGLLSRQLTQEEVKAFYDKFGYLPTVVTPALEPLALFVHKDNPVDSITLQQFDAIYSSSLKRGGAKTITTWGELGATGQWAKQPLVAQGRSATTGSQVYVQAVILGGGEFRKDLVENSSNLLLVESITKEPRSIAFAGTTYATPDVKALKLAWQDGTEAFPVTSANYPLVRQLQIVINKAPNKELAVAEKEFLKYVFSQHGQRDVLIGGFTPVPAKAATIALGAIGERTLQ